MDAKEFIALLTRSIISGDLEIVYARTDANGYIYCSVGAPKKFGPVEWDKSVIDKVIEMGRETR